MDFQKLFDAMSDQDRRTRGDYHATLGDMIDLLGAFDGGLLVQFGSIGGHPGSVHSYRGYYSDLAISKTSDAVTVGQFRKVLEDALGQTFEGYKGGDFTMDTRTPLWASEYGEASGLAVMGAVEAGGVVVLATKQID